METAERVECLRTVKSTPAGLKAALKGVRKAVLLWTPAPGKWSILEIVCHMRDMEEHAYLDRFRRVLAENEPALPDIDGDTYSLENDYRSQKLSAVLADWRRLRRDSLEVLSAVKGEQWQRAGIHETAGRLTLDDLLRRLAYGNDKAHLEQIQAIKKRYALLERLASNPARVAKALNALPAEALRRPHAPGKWSAVEIACHLRDVDRLYAERVSKAAFSDRPEWWMADNDRVAAKLRYKDSDAAAVLREYRRRREDLVSLLRALPHAAWQRTGIHPRRGELSIEKLAEVIAGHDDHHFKQIEAVTAA